MPCKSPSTKEQASEGTMAFLSELVSLAGWGWGEGGEGEGIKLMVITMLSK